MAKHLHHLLSDLGNVLYARWKPFVAAIFVGGFLLFAARAGYVWRLQHYQVQYIDGAGINAERSRIADLQLRRQAGDPKAVAELQQISENMTKRLQSLRSRATSSVSLYRSRTFFSEMGITIAVYALVVTVLMGASFLFFFVLALEGGEMRALLRRMCALALPMTRLFLWLFFSSFLWVPFLAYLTVRLAPTPITEKLGYIQAIGILLGYFCAILLCPRYALSPLFLVRDGKSVTESAHESYARTSGYWGKILSNLLVTLLLSLVLSWFIVRFFRMIIPSGNPLPLALVRALALEVAIALWASFYVHLSKEVEAHPIAQPMEEPFEGVVSGELGVRG